MAKESIAVHPAKVWLEALEAKRPELFEHGRNYAIECVIAEACKLPHPLPPGVRIQRGAERRGKQISKAAKRADKPRKKPEGE